MKTRVQTALLVFAAAAGVGLGQAGSAAADTDLAGTYNVTLDGTQATATTFKQSNPTVRTEKWAISPCGAGCAHVAIAGKNGGGESGDLHLNNGRWEMTQEFSLMHCGPGQDITLVTSFDAATLQGTQENTNHCVGDNKITTPISLTKA